MSTRCTFCGSPDWWRAAPGTARDARAFHYLADNVLEIPAVEEPLWRGAGAVIRCWSERRWQHDPPSRQSSDGAAPCGSRR